MAVVTMNKTIQETLKWFENEISSELAKPRKTASKHLDVIKDRVNDIKDTSERFDYSDVNDPDVYQNYATSIYKKTLAKMNEIEFPEVITYKNIEDFYSRTLNILNSYIEILAKYLTWLKRDRSYKTRVKNLDRAITRLQQELYKLNTKTLDEYLEYEKYESVIDDLNYLQELVNRKKEIEDEIESHRDDIERLEKMITEKEHEKEELEGHPGFAQLKENKSKLSQIEITISSKVNEIKKLCSKILKAADSRKVELDNYIRELIKSIIKNPLEELVKEADGYPGIKSMLKEIRKISDSPNIQMKKEKLEKAFNNMEEILNDSLLDLQKEAKFLLKQTQAIEEKFAELEIDRKIAKLKREIEDLKIDKDRITLAQRRELAEINKDVKNLHEDLMKRIEEYTGKQVNILLNAT